MKFDNVVLSSTGTLSLGPGCESQTLAKYEQLYRSTYYPLLTTSCTTCHSGTGPGIGAFGYPDVMVSGTNFISRFAKINTNAKTATHANGYTGTAAMIAAIDSFTPQWNAAVNEYAACSGQVLAGNGILSSSKASATIVANANANNANYVTLTWNTFTEIMNETARMRIPVTFTVQVRVATIGGVRRGYELRNPSIALNAGAVGEFRFTTIKAYVNGNYMSDVTTYSNVDATVNSTTAVNMAPGSANALVVTPTLPAATDTFAFEFGSIRDAMGVVIDPGTGAPPPPPDNLPAVVLHAELIGNNPALNVFAASCVNCHSAANASGGLNITNAAQAKALAPDIMSRMNDAANPMPRGGLLPFNRREIVRVWVQTGAN